MKSKMFKKLMAASLATVMSVGLLACGGEKPAEATPTPAPVDNSGSGSEDGGSTDGGDDDLGSSTVLIDPATGKPYDLGGMEIIVRDWWSNPDAEPANEFEQAKFDYIDEIEATYNFTIKQMAISDWASAPADFVDYVTTGGDDNNYVFIIREDAATTSAMNQGLMYDLSTLEWFDFSEAKFQSNKTHELWTKGTKINGFATGYSEPRTGMYFNKRLLEEAGVDPESIYDMQADGTWTWDAWTEIMSKVQRDIDSDGVIDVYGFDANYGVPVSAAVYSNGSEYVGLEDGKYVYKFEDAATVEALEWMVNNFKNYAVVRPADAQWDYYKQAFLNGECAFMPEDAYNGNAGGFLTLEGTDEYGFVMFPKGPQATDYTNVWSNNVVVIPGCYDAEKANKIAFAYNLFTDDVPGYEGYVDLSQYRNGCMDFRAIDETINMMMEKGMVTYHGLIPSLDTGEPFLWKFNGTTDVTAVLESIRVPYNELIDAANQ